MWEHRERSGESDDTDLADKAGQFDFAWLVAADATRLFYRHSTAFIFGIQAQKLHGTAWLNSEQDHEPDQSGHTDAAFADVGRGDREHH
jgi:hypothetical protein